MNAYSGMKVSIKKKLKKWDTKSKNVTNQETNRKIIEITNCDKVEIRKSRKLLPMTDLGFTKH